MCLSAARSNWSFNNDLFERESALKIFEKAYGWAKMCAAVVVAVLLPLAAVGIYKWSDLFSTINAAKQSVSRTAADVQHDVVKTGSDERKAIEATSAAAQRSVTQVSSNAIREGHAAVRESATARLQIAQEQSEMEGLHQQIEVAKGLQPEMIALREELTKQQKALSSSEEFARSIFASHQLEFFQPDQTASDHYRILPRKSGNGATVYVLLNKAPIRQTLQLQYHVFSQPGNSYISIHNLVIFNWADPADSLKAHQLSAAYFPDGSDREVITVLSEREGRIYADGEPLFRFGEPDPGFKGNKWIAPAQ